MKRGDKHLTPAIDFTGTKTEIEATPIPIEGMTALATDNPTAPIGKYLNGSWQWFGNGGGGSGSAFPIVSSDPVSPIDGQTWALRTELTHADGEPIGLLLALTYTDDPGVISDLQPSIYDAEKDIIKRFVME